MPRVLVAVVALFLFPNSAFGQRIEGEAIAPHVTSGLNSQVTSGGAIGRFDADSESASLSPSTGSGNLILRARGGSPCSGVPVAQVTVDGMLSEFPLTTISWRSYTVPLTAGQHSLTVSGRNLSPACNRYFRLDFVQWVDPPPPTTWRAFSDNSPWNIPAAQKGTISSSNPYASAMGSGNLEVTKDTVWSKPTFRAKVGDPTTTNVTLTTDWSPNGQLAWDGRPIPIPAGCAPATGSDGHLLLISADRRTSWEFWRATRCSTSGITAAVIAQFDLTGPGYDTTCDANSARGSGTPLVDTVVLNDDGGQHMSGLTVPNVQSDFVCPVATHADGSASNGLRYGQLFKLRDDFPVSGNAATQAYEQQLKTYGAVIVDQGAAFGVDAEPGTTLPSSLPITPADLRPVTPKALAFDDEFNGTSLDTTKWTNTWFGGAAMNGTATVASNVSVANGVVSLQLSDPTHGALIHTTQAAGRYSLPIGGTVEARIRFPGNGTDLYNWPTWWANDTDHYPAGGEHDIAEVGSSGDLNINYHSSTQDTHEATPPGYWGGAFHTYTLHRKSSSVDVYWDGVLVKSYATSDNGANEDLILNTGVGKGPTQTGPAGAMQVDYVRAW